MREGEGRGGRTWVSIHLEVDLSCLGGRWHVESEPREKARGTPRFLHFRTWWGHTVARDAGVKFQRGRSRMLLFIKFI